MALRRRPRAWGLALCALLLRAGPGGVQGNLEEPLFRAPLRRIGYHHGVSLLADNGSLDDVIFDTGSTGLTVIDGDEADFFTAFEQIIFDGCLVLYIDGYYVTFQRCTLNIGSVGLSGALVNDTYGLEPIAALNANAGLQIAEELNTTAGDYLHRAWLDGGSRGVLGSAYAEAAPERSSRSPFWRMLFSLIPVDASDVVLDARGRFGFYFASADCSTSEPSSSWLDLGGFDANATADGGLHWSEKPISEMTYHMFRVFSPRICGTPLFSNRWNNWPAVLDTGATCLRLPAEFFDTLVSFVDVSHCIYEEPNEKPRAVPDEEDILQQPQENRIWDNAMCWVHEDVAANLPTLTFKLSGTQEEDLRLDLSNLVLWDTPELTLNSTRGRHLPLCVHRGKSRDVLFNVQDAVVEEIVFGSMAIRDAFYVAIDAGHKVGMANYDGVCPDRRRRLAESGGSNDGSDGSEPELEEGCRAQPTCVGAQSYDTALNWCDRPRCQDYWFLEVDEDTQTCKPNESAFWVLVVTACFLAATDIVVFFLSDYSVFLAISGYEASVGMFILGDFFAMLRMGLTGTNAQPDPAPLERPNGGGGTEPST
mmetsp:Transcript_4288/g.12488  ORF Transcript_4288/g.12488 Transcript_4288/m.12488 type:complete len:593 (-) Transcript_4288:121-1899(-)